MSPVNCCILSPEIPGGVCRGERLTRRRLLKDIATDFGFSDYGGSEYTAGSAGSILNRLPETILSVHEESRRSYQLAGILES